MSRDARRSAVMHAGLYGIVAERIREEISIDRWGSNDFSQQLEDLAAARPVDIPASWLPKPLRRDGERWSARAIVHPDDRVQFYDGDRGVRLWMIENRL